MHNEGDTPQDATAPDAAPSPSPSPSRLLTEIGQLGRAVKHLFGAQLHLLAAELGLARSAVSWMLLAGLAATVAGVGLGLSVLGLLGVVLATWLGSWIWALLVLALLQVLFLFGAIVLFRHCMHWMSMPVTRREWSAMMRDTLHKAETEVEQDSGREARP